MPTPRTPPTAPTTMSQASADIKRSPATPAVQVDGAGAAQEFPVICPDTGLVTWVTQRVDAAGRLRRRELSPAPAHPKDPAPGQAQAQAWIDVQARQAVQAAADELAADASDTSENGDAADIAESTEATPIVRPRQR